MFVCRRVQVSGDKEERLLSRFCGLKPALL